jgi:hypothetical protein
MCRLLINGTPISNTTGVCMFTARTAGGCAAELLVDVAIDDTASKMLE